jgi:putative SOS response-associated peptidase YedK
LCGRFTTPFEGKDLEARFELSRNIDPIERSWNVFPGERPYIITKNSPKIGRRMKWGYIPFWVENFMEPKGKALINIRDDKLMAYPKKDFLSTRCLVAFEGYYEWKKFTLDGKPTKQPYYFTLIEKGINSFGGIYQVKKDAEGKEFYFFAIITTPPNSLQKPIHDRMPLIIAKDQEDEWLETDKPMDLVKPFESKLMQVWRVPTLKGNGPKLIEKLPEN